ncbi:hypothetical protein K402DRAFT_233899 [Aulographum hederae CBS 113979]|uniref:Uncharacterized protein n=1 Tax=Aulographum hederae CBS 113979 TaxID=1176131 RepID=A0A6G1GKY1_9PEZI|nr:hypothetical protein K402DRAFT_233899 [Aulographum hederae CBS 113979]
MNLELHRPHGAEPDQGPEMQSGPSASKFQGVVRPPQAECPLLETASRHRRENADATLMTVRSGFLTSRFAGMGRTQTHIPDGVMPLPSPPNVSSWHSMPVWVQQNRATEEQSSWQAELHRNNLCSIRNDIRKNKKARYKCALPFASRRPLSSNASTCRPPRRCNCIKEMPGSGRMQR